MMRRLLPILALFLSAQLPAGEEPQEMKVYFIKRTLQPPKLDGVLDDPCWKEAEVIDDFGYAGYYNQNKKLKIPRTEARFLWDDNYLYSGLTAFEADIEGARRVVCNPGPAISWRDLFEVHIDANHDQKTGFQLMANPNSERYVDASFDLVWKIEHESAWGLWADWTVKGHYQKDRWTVEIAVCLADMDVEPKVGWHIGLNVARFRFVEGTQFLCWCGQGGSHHNLKEFAHAIFVGPGKIKSALEGLKLAYRSIDKKIVRILLPNGYTILERGKESFLTYRESVLREADALSSRIQSAISTLREADERNRPYFERSFSSLKRQVTKLTKSLQEKITYPVAKKHHSTLENDLRQIRDAPVAAPPPESLASTHPGDWAEVRFVNSLNTVVSIAGINPGGFRQSAGRNQKELQNQTPSFWQRQARNEEGRRLSPLEGTQQRSALAFKK